MAEVTYYFDDPRSNVWTDTSYMADGSIETFGYTSVDGDTEEFAGGSGPATELGTITKVELRVYGYGDGNDRIDLTPEKSGMLGNEHQLTMPGSASWSAYTDITNDPNMPSPWTFSSIWFGTFKCYVEFDKVGKGNTMYCAKVEIRVTYTPSNGAQWKQVQYTSEPPTSNAWNQLKHTSEGGWNQIKYEGE